MKRRDGWPRLPQSGRLKIARGFREKVEDFLLVAECRKFYPELLRGWPDNAVDNWGTCTCYVSPNLGAVRMATPQEKMGTENGDCHFYDCPHFHTGMTVPILVPIFVFLPPRSLSGVFEFRRSARFTKARGAFRAGPHSVIF